MSKHTAGPWHVANGCQIRSDKDQIAKAWMMRGDEGKANAHLIAASPSLYEFVLERAINGDTEAKSMLESLHLFN